MDNTQTIALLIGALMPFIITLVKQSGLNRWWNLLIAVASCGIAGTLTVWARGELQWGNWLAVVGVVFVASQAVYAAFWKDSGVETKIDELSSIIK